MGHIGGELPAWITPLLEAVTFVGSLPKAIVIVAVTFASSDVGAMLTRRVDMKCGLIDRAHGCAVIAEKWWVSAGR
jgi:hypothetical protein